VAGPMPLANDLHLSVVVGPVLAVRKRGVVRGIRAGWKMDVSFELPQTARPPRRCGFAEFPDHLPRLNVEDPGISRPRRHRFAVALPHGAQPAGLAGLVR